ncbi:MAG: LysR substrate-binding domain-containing protein [Alphaproteobacteria bacterium]
MNWDDLRLFLAVARAGRLGDAAAILNLDEATLSRRVRRLEKALSTTLFERTRKGHALTQKGEALMAEAERMEEATNAATRKIGGAERGAAGTVRLSVAEGFGSRLVAPNMARFQRAFPQLELELVAGAGFLSPSRREADIAVGLSRPTTGRITVRKLADYELGLYGAESWLNAVGPLHGRASLNQLPLIGYVDDLLYAPELRYVAEALPGLKPTLRSTSINAQYEMARAGAGLAILPKFMVQAGDGLKRVLSDDVAVARSFWLSVHEDIKDLPRIRAVIDFLGGLVTGRTPAPAQASVSSSTDPARIYDATPSAAQMAQGFNAKGAAVPEKQVMKRVSLTLPEQLWEDISKVTRNRSRFLVDAAREKLARG